MPLAAPSCPQSNLQLPVEKVFPLESPQTGNNSKIFQDPDIFSPVFIFAFSWITIRTVMSSKVPTFGEMKILTPSETTRINLPSMLQLSWAHWTPSSELTIATCRRDRGQKEVGFGTTWPSWTFCLLVLHDLLKKVRDQTMKRTLTMPSNNPHIDTITIL